MLRFWSVSLLSQVEDAPPAAWLDGGSMVWGRVGRLPLMRNNAPRS